MAESETQVPPCSRKWRPNAHFWDFDCSGASTWQFTTAKADRVGRIAALALLTSCCCSLLAALCACCCCCRRESAAFSPPHTHSSCPPDISSFSPQPFRPFTKHHPPPIPHSRCTLAALDIPSFSRYVDRHRHLSDGSVSSVHPLFFPVSRTVFDRRT